MRIMRIWKQTAQNWKGLASILAITQVTALAPVQSWAWIGHYESSGIQKVECPTTADLEFDHGAYAFILRLTGSQNAETIKMEGINQPEFCVDGKEAGFRECFETQVTADTFKWTQVNHFVPSSEIFLKKSVLLTLSNQDQELNLYKSISGMGLAPTSISCNYLKR